MGFLSKIWKDRVSEYPNRRILTDEDGNESLVTVARSEGNISEVGDSFSAENMNDLEQRVADGFEEVNNSLISDIYVGEDGKLHKVQGGADSVLPFSSIPKSGTVFTTSGVNLQEYFPNTWQKLRTSDFVCGVTSVSGTSQVGREDKSTGYNGSFSFSSDAVSVNYDSTTGILTFGSFSSTRGTKSWAYWNGGNNQNTVNVSGNNPFCAWKGTYSG